MQQSTVSKSQGGNTNLIWKMNDNKAQKNGPHSNIYWVKVSFHLSRNNLWMRTVHKNPISGSAPTSTSAIGLITRSMALESNTTQTVTSTKADGKVTSVTVKELTGSPMPKTNLGGSILEIGKQGKSRVEERCFISQGIVMMGCGWIIFLTARVVWSSKMAMYTKECGSRGKEAVTVFSLKDAATISKATGSMIWGKAKDHTSSPRKTKSSWVNGSLTLQKRAYTHKSKTLALWKSNAKNTSRTLTSYHPSTRSASKTPRESYNNPSKKCARTEQPTAHVTSPSMNCTLKANFCNFKNNSALQSTKPTWSQSWVSRRSWSTWVYSWKENSLFRTWRISARGIRMIRSIMRSLWGR